MTGFLNLLILSSEKKKIIGHFFSGMILVLYLLGHGSFRPVSLFFSSPNQFFVAKKGRVLTSQIEES